MANFTVQQLVQKGLDFTVGLAKRGELSAEDKSIVSQALQQLGQDINGDGTKDVNDYPDMTKVSNKEYQEFINACNPNKSEENREKGKEETNKNMKETGGQTDDKDYNGHANTAQVCGYVSTGLNSMSQGVSQFAESGVKTLDEAGAKALNKAKNVEDSATNAAKAGDKAGHTDGWGIAAAALALAAGVLDVANAGQAVTDANNMQGKNAAQAKDAQQNIKDAEALNAKLEEGNANAEAIKDEIEERLEEEQKRSDEYNKEVLGKQGEDMGNTKLIEGIAKHIEDGTATEDELKVYNSLIGEHEASSTEAAALSEENISLNEEASEEMAARSADFEVIQENNDLIHGAAEAHQQFAEQNIKNAQNDQKAATKMQQTGQMAVTTDTVAAGLDTVNSIKNFATAFKGVFVDVNSIVAGGLFAAAAVTEGTAAGMQAVSAHKSEQNLAEQTQNLNVFNNANNTANALEASADNADGVLGANRDTTLENVDLMENTEAFVAEFDNYATTISGSGSEDNKGSDDVDKDKKPEEDKKA